MTSETTRVLGALASLSMAATGALLVAPCMTARGNVIATAWWLLPCVAIPLAGAAGWALAHPRPASDPLLGLRARTRGMVIGIAVEVTAVVVTVASALSLLVGWMVRHGLGESPRWGYAAATVVAGVCGLPLSFNVGAHTAERVSGYWESVSRELAANNGGRDLDREVHLLLVDGITYGGWAWSGRRERYRRLAGLLAERTRERGTVTPETATVTPETATVTSETATVTPETATDASPGAATGQEPPLIT